MAVITKSWTRVLALTGVCTQVLSQVASGLDVCFCILLMEYDVCASAAHVYSCTALCRLAYVPWQGPPSSSDLILLRWESQWSSLRFCGREGLLFCRVCTDRTHMRKFTGATQALLWRSGKSGCKLIFWPDHVLVNRDNAKHLRRNLSMNRQNT